MRLCFFAAIFLLMSAAGSPSSACDDRTITVCVDPRIELLSIIQQLSGYGDRTRLITRFDVAYKNEAAERFGAFKDHRAIKLFDIMSREGFSFDGPVHAVLHLDGPPEFVLRAELSDAVCERAGPRERLIEFFEAMREFYRESDFQKFFDEHAELYDACAIDTRDRMAGISIATLEDYYGLRKHDYRIVLAPLLHPGGFGPQIALPDDSLDIFSVNGPQGAVDGRPTFGDEDDLRYLVWHEFSHSFLNPLAERNPGIIERTKSLHAPLAAAMKRQAYGDWETCVKEHLVRAATVRFAFRELGEDAGNAALEHEKSRGFVYVEALADRLKQYEQQRDEYKTIDDFAPQLLAVFDEALANADKVVFDDCGWTGGGSAQGRSDPARTWLDRCRSLAGRAAGRVRSGHGAGRVFVGAGSGPRRVSRIGRQGALDLAAHLRSARQAQARREVLDWLQRGPLQVVPER